MTGGFLFLIGPCLTHWAHKPGKWHFSVGPASQSRGGSMSPTYQNANSRAGLTENGTKETFLKFPQPLNPQFSSTSVNNFM